MLLFLGALLLLEALALPASLRLGSARGWVSGDNAQFAVLGIAVVAVLAERGRIKIVGTIEVSISLVPIIYAAVLFGSPAAMLVGAASFLAELRGPFLR